LLVVGNCPIGLLILLPRILVRWFFWELNPEVLVSLCLKDYVMGRREVPLSD
jgi:hypothetical protein